MPPIWSYFNRLFHYTDLFAHTSLLRYNMESDYSTATGGFLSFVIVIVFAALFFSLGLRTVRKEIINSSVQTQSEISPSVHTITMGPGGDMMFGILIGQLDLSASPRLFDVTLVQQFYTTGYTLQNSTSIALQQCTQQHFNFGAEFTNLNSRIPISSALCPQIGQKLTVNGKISSNSFSQFKVRVNRCNTSDSTCASDVLFAVQQSILGNFQMLIPMVNTFVNPGNEQYIDYYLQDQNVMVFDSALGSYGSVYIREDTIVTDESVMPWTSDHQENITRITDPFINSQFLASSAPQSLLAEVTFMKSAKSDKFSRDFYKVDAFFSYVGGLMGTLIFIFFILKFYSQKSFEVSVAKRILVDNQNGQIQANSFHFFNYLLTLFKRAFRVFNIQLNWPDTTLILESSFQASRQMDIVYLIRKTHYFDAAITRLLEKYNIDGKPFEERPTLQKCEELRSKNVGVEVFKKKFQDTEVGSQNHQNHISQQMMMMDANEISKQSFQLNFNSVDSFQQGQLTLEKEKKNKTDTKKRIEPDLNRPGEIIIERPEEMEGEEPRVQTTKVKLGTRLPKLEDKREVKEQEPKNQDVGSKVD